MRILHFVPDIGSANGVLSAVLNFARSMPEDIKFDIVYFHETEENKKDEIEALGSRVFKISAPSPKTVLNGEIKKLFNEHKGEWSALHIHAPHFAVFIAQYAKRAGIKKICVHCHSTEFSLKGNSKRNELLSLYSKYFIKDRFACSDNAGKLWYGNKPFTVINNAIDCKKFAFDEKIRAAKRKELGLRDEFVVAHIGRTDIPQKNHNYLLTVFNEIVQINENSVLLLIGGEKTDLLFDFCKKQGIEDKVRFMGIRHDIPELLCASDVFVFPSTKEGLPVSVIEAQASGLPVVMSDTVTKEAIITDLVIPASLSLSPSYWAMVCTEDIDTSRPDTFKTLQEKKWDINSVSEILEAYYKE